MPSISEIDEIINKYVMRELVEAPGCSLAVAQGGEIIHSKSYGMADLDHGTKNETHTVFFAASLSKQFTAMSILLLSDEIEEGKRIRGKKIIKLDNDVREYIHELNGLDKKKYRKITIRQLLHHTSGIRDMLIQLALAGWRWGDDMISRKDVLDLASRMKTLNFPPDKDFAYSNTNYFLAGEIVKRVSEENSLAEFASKNIFKPLDMTSTRFVDSYREIVKNRASGYRRRKPPAEGFEKRTPNYDLTGPTNLFTTAEDLLRWAGNFDKEGDKVGGKSAVDALQRPANNWNSYGLGLYVYRDGNDKPLKIYHNGRTIGYRAHFHRDIQNRISIALLCNVEFTYFRATDDLVEAISRVVQNLARRSAHEKLSPYKPTLDQVERDIPPGTKDAEALKDYCGIYYNSEIDTEYEVKRDVGSEGVSLVIKRPRYRDCTLVDFPTFPDDKFVARDFADVLREVEVTFHRNDDKTIKGFELDWAKRVPGSRLMKFWFDRIQGSGAGTT